MVVADAKLSKGTDLTDGQKLAKAGVGSNLNVKAEKRVDAFGTPLQNAQLLQSGKQIKQTKFLEIHGNGQGIYNAGGIK